MPVVTALITVYNEEEWIASAIQSLLSQTLEDIEVLVIDDGSTDETLNILESFDDSRLRIVPKGRMGRAAALAFGTVNAQGEYVAILDADDRAYPERLARQVAFFEAHPAVAWLGCGEERRDTQRHETAQRLYPQRDTDIRRMAARCIPYSHSGVTFRRSIVDEGLNYDPTVPYLIDFEFFLRVAERHQVANLPDVLVMRRLRDESFFQSRYKRRQQNRALVRLSVSAVRRLSLPIYFLSFPIARLFYDLIPNTMKRRVRRVLGLQEHFTSTK